MQLLLLVAPILFAKYSQYPQNLLMEPNKLLLYLYRTALFWHLTYL